MRDRIFKLSPIHASVIFQIFTEFVEFTEFNESYAPFRKNSNVLVLLLPVSANLLTFTLESVSGESGVTGTLVASVGVCAGGF